MEQHLYQSKTSSVVTHDSVTRLKLVRDTDNALQSVIRAARREVEGRRRQVANGWSKLERAERRRVGIARRAWLLDSIDHTSTTR